LVNIYLSSMLSNLKKGIIFAQIFFSEKKLSFCYYYFFTGTVELTIPILDISLLGSGGRVGVAGGGGLGGLGDFNSQLTAFNYFLVCCMQSFLLVFSTVELNEPESLAAAVALGNNVGALDVQASEDLREFGVIHGEGEVGNEQPVGPGNPPGSGLVIGEGPNSGVRWSEAGAATSSGGTGSAIRTATIITATIRAGSSFTGDTGWARGILVANSGDFDVDFTTIKVLPVEEFDSLLCFLFGFHFHKAVT